MWSYHVSLSFIPSVRGGSIMAFCFILLSNGSECAWNNQSQQGNVIFHLELPISPPLSLFPALRYHSHWYTADIHISTPHSILRFLAVSCTGSREEMLTSVTSSDWPVHLKVTAKLLFMFVYVSGLPFKHALTWTHTYTHTHTHLSRCKLCTDISLTASFYESAFW